MESNTVYQIRLPFGRPLGIFITLDFIPQIRPTKIDREKYQFLLGKLISLANVYFGNFKS
ncbi:MAG: hypothetical protein ACI9P5_002567 [Saprospiraceae bacterium]|jgi:hypothetical protein